MIRKLPKKKGFKPINKTEYVAINLFQLEKVGKKIVTEENIRERFGIAKKFGIKVLAKGNVRGKLTVKDVVISAAAKRKIEAAGGKVTSSSKK